MVQNQSPGIGELDGGLGDAVVREHQFPEKTIAWPWVQAASMTNQLHCERKTRRESWFGTHHDCGRKSFLLTCKKKNMTFTESLILMGNWS